MEPTADYGARRTRSNRPFSPYATYMSTGSAAFDLALGLRSAILCEACEPEEHPGDPPESGAERPPQSPSTPAPSPNADANAVQGAAQPYDEMDAKKRRRDRKKSAGHSNRKKARLEKQGELQGGAYASPYVRPGISSRYSADAPRVQCDTATEKSKVARGAFVGLNDKEKDGRAYTLAEVTGEGSELGFELKKWDGNTSILIVDKSGRIACVLAGWPADNDWEQVHRDAANALESQRSLCSFPQEKLDHRRGSFASLRCGVSHGGGQTHPMNLQNEGANKAAIDTLNGLSCFKRIAGFGSAVMKHRAPHIYCHYLNKLGLLHRNDASLKRPFASSVFSAATYNLGPRTVCYKHKDFANLPFGWCAITALGTFDYTKGGHLILWDCGLVVEFPPGATILLPSAIIAHSNVAIGVDERRYSFAQYSAGGLFRWVENNFCKAKEYRASLSVDKRSRRDVDDAERWELGLSLWPTVDLTATPPSVD